ncbi:MAG: CDP-glycerol glycerophosphotransferase family protein [Desulfurococcales archaeon]|nr:CDP-glycerol glycerophosphotransferase family protein [Desulfurococcales archaeon]
MVSRRLLSNIALRVLENTVGQANPANNVCLYGPTLDANLLVMKDFIIDNELNIKFNFKILYFTSKNVNINIDKNQIPINSIKGLWNYIRHCKIFLATNNIFAKDRYPIHNRKSLMIQLWHGLPIKSRPKQTTSFNLDSFDIFLSTSSFSSYLLASYMDVPVEKFKVTGYPRNDKLLRPNARIAAREILYKYLKIKNNFSKYIIYMPTFRRYNFKVHINIASSKIVKTAIKNNYFLVIKYHIVDEMSYKKEIEYIKDKLNRYNNVFVLRTPELASMGLTIYDLLPAFDILITDYSSISNDFLLLDKPIIFYTPDLDQYYDNEGLIYPKRSLPDIFPGPILISDGDFNEDLVESDNYTDNRRRMRNLLHEYTDDKSSYRLWKIIEDYLQQ